MHSKLLIKKRYKVGISLIIGVLLVYALLFMMNRFIEPQLLSLAKKEVNNGVNYIVDEVLSTIEYSSEQLILNRYDSSGNIIGIQYNSNELNSIQNKANKLINESLLNAQKGSYDQLLGRIIYENGIVYKMKLGYLTQATLLSNIGPSINIKMRTNTLASTNIDIQSKEYGLNNTLLTISLRVKVKAQVIVANLTITEIEIINDIPLVIQVIQGEVPNYVPMLK
ncbi:MAG: sporulation protein YunB [Erysipelotrichaceae bacterium]